MWRGWKWETEPTQGSTTRSLPGLDHLLWRRGVSHRQRGAEQSRHPQYVCVMSRWRVTRILAYCDKRPEWKHTYPWTLHWLPHTQTRRKLCRNPLVATDSGGVRCWRWCDVFVYPPRRDEVR